MKKLLSILLVAVMVAAMFVPVTISATEPADPRGTLAFEENFDDSTRVDAAKADKLGYEDEIESITVEDGLMTFSTGTVGRGTIAAPRLKMYTVPEGVTEFTAVVKFKTNTTTELFGLVVADNLKDGTTASASDTTVQLFWARPTGTNTDGIRTYLAGGSQAGWKNDTQDFYQAGEWHELTVTVDLTTNTGVSTLAKWDGEKFEAYSQMDEKAFDYCRMQGINPNIGIMSKNGDVIVDYLQVYTKSEGYVRPVADTLIYEENFNDPTKVDAWKAALKGNTGFLTHDGSYLKVENGQLKFKNSFSGDTGVAPRFTLFNVPDDATTFTVEMEFCVQTDNNDAANCLGLMIADNGKDSWDSENSKVKENADGSFQLFWARTTSWNSGIRGYKGNSSTTPRPIEIAKLHTLGTWHKVTINVDLNKNSALFMLEKKTGEEYAPVTACVDGPISFTYMTENDVVPSIGLLACSYADATIEYVKVLTNEEAVSYTETKLTGSSVKVGDSFAMEYGVTFADKDVNANNKVTAKVTFMGETTEIPIVDQGDGVGKFQFNGVAPQNIGEVIIAKLYVEGVEVSKRDNYSVKQNLEAYIVGWGAESDYGKIAQAALVYCGVAQEYLGREDTVSGIYELPAELNKPTVDELVIEGSKITAAGLYFDYTNKIYFKFDTEGVTDIKINGESVGVAEKIYTDEIFAVDLHRAEYTVEVYTDSATPDSTITYSLYDYIARKWDSQTIGNLAKALYNYAEAARAFAN